MVYTRWKDEKYITDWHQFNRVIRSAGRNLLGRLDEFPDSILVTGCQRSGTTMLSRIINQSDDVTHYWFGPDDELDAALILSGYVDHIPHGRYCFQTTYVNENHEYYQHQNGHKIIFILRNPYSVVYSMLYNWSDWAVDALFEACVAPLLTGIEKGLYKLLGSKAVRRIRRACLAYNGKTTQVFDLSRRLSPDQLMIIDYDDLVARKTTVLPAIYRFAGLNYHEDYARWIRSTSLQKASRLSEKEARIIALLSVPLYKKARTLLTNI